MYKQSESVIVPRTSKINSKNDLKNAVVGVEKGTVFEDSAQSWKKNNLVKDVLSFENTSKVLDAINNGEIDAGVSDSTLVKNFFKNKNFLEVLRDYTPEIPGTSGIAVKKRDITLLSALNEKISEMKADGTLYAILVENGLDRNNIISN